jgi:hypothetical protein
MSEPSGSATITLSRAKGGGRDLLRAYKVLIDDVQVAKIRRGQRLTLPVSAGQHTVRLTIDWTSSLPLELDLAPGASAELACAPAGPGFTADNYIELKRA